MPLANLTQSNLPRFIERIDRLSADTKPKWGEMDSARMLAHMRVIVEMSLGEGGHGDHSTWWQRNVVRPIAFSVLPTWPKGKIKVPERYTPVSDATFEEERAKLYEAFRRFTEALERDPTCVNPHALFGPCTLKYWSRMHARHFEHHFQQFGIYKKRAATRRPPPAKNPNYLLTSEIARPIGIWRGHPVEISVAISTSAASNTETFFMEKSPGPVGTTC